MQQPGSGERIVVAEDEDITRAVVVHVLKGAGYRVLEARDGREALALVLAEQPALAIVDVEMPEMSGLKLVQELRDRGLGLPLLILSGRVTVEDRVTGLSTGADDYLIKPCAPEELIARVQALLRKHGRTESPATVVQLGQTAVDLEAKVATVAGKTVRLTRTECAIIALLARNRGRPVAREQLLGQVWGYTYLPETRTLDTHIWRLRRKLGDTAEDERWITNISGVGYQLNLAAPA